MGEDTVEVIFLGAMTRSHDCWLSSFMPSEVISLPSICAGHMVGYISIPAPSLVEKAVSFLWSPGETTCQGERGWDFGSLQRPPWCFQVWGHFWTRSTQKLRSRAWAWLFLGYFRPKGIHGKPENWGKWRSKWTADGAEDSRASGAN